MADFANTPDRLWIYCYDARGAAPTLDHMTRFGCTHTGVANALADAEAYVAEGYARTVDIFVQVEGRGDRLVQHLRSGVTQGPRDFFDRCKVLKGFVDQHRIR